MHKVEVILIVAHVEAVNVYVAAVKALRKNERRGITGSNSVWHKKVVHFSALY